MCDVRVWMWMRAHVLYLHEIVDFFTYLHKFHVSDYQHFQTSIQFHLLYVARSVSSYFIFHKILIHLVSYLIESCCIQRHSIHGMMEEENVIRPHQEIQALNFEEKKFLLAVERGDVAGTRR